jgi:hypothetical protein
MDTMSKKIEKAAKAAIKAGGGPAEVARKLTAITGKRITLQAIQQWTRIPQDWVKAMGQITGWPLHKLRPDLADAPKAAPAEARA